MVYDELNKDRKMLKGKNRLPIREAFLFLLAMLFFLAGCSSEMQQSIDECEEQFPPYAEKMGEIQAEWDDAIEMAASTSRIALTGPVSDLQAIRREASGAEPPVCVTARHEVYLTGMDSFISFFLDFMSDADSELDDSEIRLATLNMMSLTSSLERYEKDPERYFEDLRGGAAALETQEAEEDQ